ERDGRRFAAIAASDLFEPGDVILSGQETMSARLGENVPAGLDIRGGLAVDPRVLLAAWLPGVRRARVGAVAPAEGGGWAVLGEDGLALARADVVCLAAGVDCNTLHPGLNLQAVRGQASWTDDETIGGAAAFGGYAIPTRTGVLFGATHDRDDTDTAVRQADNERNLAVLAKTLPKLAARLEGSPLAARASLRATTRDYMPIAGALGGAEPGLFVLSGLGSRGFTLAPLLAEHIAALALDRPSPLPKTLARLVDPLRFSERAGV
ncbi:MAG TPA: FAD-dependent oxidoreductase, partial [Caulobacteraceae bacterium]